MERDIVIDYNKATGSGESALAPMLSIYIHSPAPMHGKTFY